MNPSRRVLIADADRARADALAELFRTRDLTAEVVDPSRALAAMETEPGLVLADIGHPTPEGLEVLKQIRAHPTLGGTPVIMLSALPTTTERARAFASRANGYVTHPESAMDAEDLVMDLVAIWLAGVAA